MKIINKNKRVYLYEAEGYPRGGSPSYTLKENDESSLFWHMEPLNSFYDNIKRFSAYSTEEALNKIRDYLILKEKAWGINSDISIDNHSNKIIVTHPSSNKVAIIVTARKVEDNPEWIS